MKFTFRGFNGEVPPLPPISWEPEAPCSRCWFIFLSSVIGVLRFKQDVEAEHLTPEDQLFILMQTGLYLTATRGHATREVRICYERAEPLCHSLNHPVDLFAALIGQWRHSLLTDKLATTMQLAKRAYSAAREQDEVSLLTNAFRILAVTHYFSGNFKVARRYAQRGVQLGREGRIRSRFEEVNSPVVVCLSFDALCGWHFGETALFSKHDGASRFSRERIERHLCISRRAVSCTVCSSL